jgi:amidase
MKVALICGTHLRRRYLGRYYATAQNLRAPLTAAYDRIFDDLDFLVMPTTPGRPHADDKDLSIAERVIRGWAVLSNTTPFDMTGHPAVTIPAAEAGGLPVGVMLVGRHFEDGQLLAIARTYEMNFGWVPEHPAAPARNRPSRVV